MGDWGGEREMLYMAAVRVPRTAWPEMGDGGCVRFVMTRPMYQGALYEVGGEFVVLVMVGVVSWRCVLGLAGKEEMAYPCEYQS